MTIRRRITALLAGLSIVSAVLPSEALAWNAKGHAMVGAIADHALAGHANALNHINALIHMTLEEAGPWADCAKSVQIQGSGVTFNYNREPALCRMFHTDEAKRDLTAFASHNWTPTDASGNGFHNSFH